MILDLLEQEKVSLSSEFASIETQIKALKSKQNKLLDLKLDETINEHTYLSKNNQIENEIKDLLEQKEKMKKDDFTKKTQIMLELAGSYYTSYFSLNYE